MKRVEPIKTREKIDHMKQILKSNSLRNYCMFVVGINCAMRVTDLIRIEWQDVLDQDGSIRKVLSTIAGEPLHIAYYSGFPITVTMTEAINEYLKIRQNIKLREPVFVSRKTKQGDPVAVQRNIVYIHMSDAAKKAHIDNFGTHTMRKTWGYMAIQKGASIEYVQRIFNHSSTTVTAEYLGLSVHEEVIENIIINLNL